jgi:hypothetical protein
VKLATLRVGLREADNRSRAYITKNNRTPTEVAGAAVTKTKNIKR